MTVAGVSLAVPSIAWAENLERSPYTAGLSSKEMAVVLETAKGLEELDKQGGIFFEDGTYQELDLDSLFAALDEGKSEQEALLVATGSATPMVTTYRWNNNHFAKCIATKVGFADIKAIIVAFNEPSVRKALKSKQWKKASAIAFRILKRVSPKLAKFLIKKAAHSILPGGVIGQLAWIAGQCALGEL